jgi:hypothetical protein
MRNAREGTEEYKEARRKHQFAQIRLWILQMVERERAKRKFVRLYRECYKKVFFVADYDSTTTEAISLRDGAIECAYCRTKLKKGEKAESFPGHTETPE